VNSLLSLYEYIFIRSLSLHILKVLVVHHIHQEPIKNIQIQIKELQNSYSN